MSSETCQLTEAKRKAKTESLEKYKDLKAKVQKEVSEDKQRYLQVKVVL